MKRVKSIIGTKSGHTRQACVMDAWLKSRDSQRVNLYKVSQK
jgi:hypothetical protein